MEAKSKTKSRVWYDKKNQFPRTRNYYFDRYEENAGITIGSIRGGCM